MRKIFAIQIIAILVLLSILITVGCQQESELSSTEPHTSLPEKGNPKLDSQLNQLVLAESQGQAASFAEKSNIELVDGKVRVIVECLPDQVDAAIKASSALGIVETSYDNLLQVVVPITSLSTLADAASIRFIRLPQQPLPAPNKQE